MSDTQPVKTRYQVKNCLVLYIMCLILCLSFFLSLFIYLFIFATDFLFLPQKYYSHKNVEFFSIGIIFLAVIIPAISHNQELKFLIKPTVGIEPCSMETTGICFHAHFVSTTV